MKKKTVFLIYIFFIAFYSCKKNADLELPYTEPKLVISSFITPQDSLIQAAVSLSEPLYNNPNQSTTYKPITDAKVEITDGINIYNLTYNIKLQRYVIDSSKLKIRAGITYTMAVSTHDGKNAKASTTVPYLNNSLTYSIQKHDKIKTSYSVTGKWIDNNLQVKDNYIFDVVYTSLSFFSGHNSNGDFNDTIKIRSINYKMANDSEGQYFEKTLEFSIYDTKKDSVYVDLITISDEYTKYFNKLGDAASALSTPFSQPVQMYTNIDGGLGIFAGLNRYSLRIFP